MNRTHYSYCIFYLENKYYKDINKELRARGYHNIRAIVPTVKFIKNISSRGHIIYQEEPLLFSYGFMKLPTKLAYDRVYLNSMKRSIPGIRGWLRSTESLHRKRGKKRRVENAEDFDDYSKVAMVPRSEVRKFIELGHTNSHLTFSEITSVKAGDYIRLNEYPFIGADAIVIKVDKGSNRVRLRLYPNYSNDVRVWVPIDIVIHSIYQDYNPRVSLHDQRDHLEDLPNNCLDNVFMKHKSYKRKKIKET